MKTFLRVSLFVLVMPLTCLTAAPVGLWDENVNGDLSNFSGSADDNPGSPTNLGLLVPEVGGGPRQYRVFGISDAATGDFFTIEIGPGNQLQSILLQQYQYIGDPMDDDQFFMAISSGNSFTVGYDQLNTNGFPFLPGNSSGFPPSDLSRWLGGSAISQAFIGQNILPQLSTVTLGQPGFTPPLGPGQYTFLVQQTGPASTFMFDFEVVSVTAIPEPSTSLAMFGIGVAVWWKRRRTRN